MIQYYNYRISEVKYIKSFIPEINWLISINDRVMYGGLPGKKPWLVRDQAPLLKCAMKDQENELKLMIHDTL